MIKRELEQLPPSLHLQILSQLTPPDMELLPSLLLRDPILRTRPVHRP